MASQKNHTTKRANTTPNGNAKPGAGAKSVKVSQIPKQKAPQDVNNVSKSDAIAVIDPSNVEQVNKRLVRANMVTLGALLMSTIANVCLAWYATSAKVEVIGVTETGAVINPVPLAQAFVTEPRVLSFVDECLRESFSHDFENYRRTMNSAMSCYTSLGGKEFNKAIDATLLEIR